MPAQVDLEKRVAQVERHLDAMGHAMRSPSADGVEHEAQELQRALTAAVHGLNQAARAGEVPPSLRQRLALASGQIAAQREALARATAALDRAIDVLMPGASARVAYSANGQAERAQRAAVVQA